MDSSSSRDQNSDGKEPYRLKLGDELNGTVVKPLGGSRYQIKCRHAPNGFSVTLHTLRSEEVEAGHHSTFWVAKIVPLRGEILVREGDFGRLPISPSMAPRYLTAIRGLLSDDAPSGDALGEAKAMVGRIAKQNQADWLTVWRLLGEPGAGDCRRLVSLIDELKRVIKEEPDQITGIQGLIREEFGGALTSAVRRLTKLIDGANARD